MLIWIDIPHVEDVFVCLVELLGGTGHVFKEAAGSVLHSYTAVREAVEQGVDDCKAKLLRQEELTKGSQDAILQILVRRISQYELGKLMFASASVRLIKAVVKSRGL